MNSVRKGALAAVLGLGLAGMGLAQAQTAPAPAPAAKAAHDQHGRFGHAASLEERKARRAEHMAKRQAKLREALKLTPAQESAFSAFMNAGKPSDQARRPDRAAWATLSAPQRMEQRIAMQRERTARMEARLAALNSFYAVLTPEQKKTFDEVSAKRRGGRHHGMHHGHRMHG